MLICLPSLYTILRYGLLAVTVAFSFLGKAQEWQDVESIGYSRYSHPLVMLTKDGKQYYYHLDSQLSMDDMKTRATGMTIGMKDGAYGVIRDDGKLIVPFEYDEVRVEDDYTGQWYEGIPYNYKFILLQKDGRYGYADTNGNILAQPVHEQLKVISKHIIAVGENGSWGWLDAETGEELQPYLYEDVDKTYGFEQYVSIQKDGKYGMAEKDGTVVVPIESERSLFFPRLATATYIISEKNDTYTVYDSLGEVRLQGNFPHPLAASNSNLLTYQQDNRTGLLDPHAGKVVFEPQFSRIRGRVRALHIVEKDKKYGVVHEQGNLLLPVEYDAIEFVNKAGKVKQDAQIINIGFYSKSGSPLRPEQVARIQYEAKIDSLPYLIRVVKDGYSGILDWESKPIVPLGQYQIIVPHYYHDKLYFFVHKDGTTGILDGAGKELLSSRYALSDSYQYNTKALDTLLEIKHRYVLLELPKEEDDFLAPVGLFDLKTARLIVKPEPQSIKWLNEHYFTVSKSERGDPTINNIALYNASGEVVLRFDKDIRDVHILNNGFLLVEKTKGYRDGLYVLMDTSGNVLYENAEWRTRGNYAHIRFPEATGWVNGDFHGGWKKVYADETNLFVDEKGEEKRFSGYDQVDAFVDGYALVTKKEDGEHYARYGVIDSTGQEVFPLVWGSVYLHANDNPYVLKVEQDGKMGLVDRRGKVILPTEYEHIESAGSKDYLTVRKGDKYGLLSADGRIVMEPRYDEIRRNYERKGTIWPLLVKDDEWYYFIGEDGEPYNIRGRERN